MSIEIEPAELGFKRQYHTAPCEDTDQGYRTRITDPFGTIGPFTQEVCQLLHVRNDSEEPVVFKVR